MPGGHLRMVYLLHFDRGYKHARHYIGATSSPDAARELARGAVPPFNVPLLNAARLDGVTFTVAQTWPGDEVEAAKLRAQGGASRLCRCCALERRSELVS